MGPGGVGPQEVSPEALDPQLRAVRGEFDRGVDGGHDDADPGAAPMHPFGEVQHLHGIAAVTGDEADVDDVGSLGSGRIHVYHPSVWTLRFPRNTLIMNTPPTPEPSV